MGMVKNVKLISGIIYNSNFKISNLIEELRKEIGEIDLKSNAINFNFTKYYSKEMGPDLLRFWISFEKLIPPSEIVNMKLKTIEIEAKFSINKNRQVNIDPGYITDSKLVLVSTKDFSHRIYLDKGIYAEITLMFKNKKFNILPWTYPDYRLDSTISFFEDVRNKYLNEL